jgi:uncharacterized membrane protein
MKKQAFWQWFVLRLRTYLLAGIVVVVPIAASILVLIWLFESIDNILQPIIINVLGHQIVGLGFALTIILILISGIIARNYLGNRIVKFVDFLLQKVPLFRQVYVLIRQVIESITGTGGINKAAFREVVLVEFPIKGMHMLSFITNEFKADNGEKYYSVYIPSTPVPWTGWLSILKEDDFTRTKISIDEALKMAISGAMIAPDVIQILIKDKCLTLSKEYSTKVEI